MQFNGITSNSDLVASRDMMVENSELERMWKEAVIA